MKCPTIAAAAAAVGALHGRWFAGRYLKGAEHAHLGMFSRASFDLN